ncbi:DUF6053 domain-containing protein [Lysobacter enzymogenes]|uniref:DUF6053 domain-containing protein n=1 Tax=Lysobacter enzymogenes TaxID=69 RepID=UPI003CCCB27E
MWEGLQARCFGLSSPGSFGAKSIGPEGPPTKAAHIAPSRRAGANARSCACPATQDDRR